MKQLEKLQQRAKQVGQLSEEEQGELIDDAKKLGTRKTPKLNAYLGPSIAHRLAESFSDAGLPKQSIRVYREFAESLEQLRDEGLNAAIESLRESADQLESSMPAPVKN